MTAASQATTHTTLRVQPMIVVLGVAACGWLGLHAAIRSAHAIVGAGVTLPDSFRTMSAIFAVLALAGTLIGCILLSSRVLERILAGRSRRTQEGIAILGFIATVASSLSCAWACLHSSGCQERDGHGL